MFLVSKRRNRDSCLKRLCVEYFIREKHEQND